MPRRVYSLRGRSSAFGLAVLLLGSSNASFAEERVPGGGANPELPFGLERLRFVEMRPALGYSAASFTARSLPSDPLNPADRKFLDALQTSNLESYLHFYKQEKDLLAAGRVGSRLTKAAVGALTDSPATGTAAAVAAKVAAEATEMAVEAIFAAQEKRIQGVLGSAIKSYLEANNRSPEFFDRYRGKPFALLEELRKGPVDPLDPSQTADWDPTEIAIYNRAVVGALNREVNTLIDAALDNRTQIEKTQQAIRKFARVQTDFIRQTSERFRAVAGQIEAVNERLGTLEDRVDRVEAGVAQNAEDIAFLQDYMFTRMTPAEQLAALRSGRLLRDLPEAERVALEEKIELTKKREELMADIGGFINGAGQMLQIAGDLGIELPEEVSTAANLAQSAFGAFQAFAGGNYLAGVSMLTGAFSGKPDVATQRHQQLVGMLNQVLEGIGELKEGQQRIMDMIEAVQENQRQIMENQQKIYTAVVDLAVDVERKHRELITELEFVGREVYNARLGLSGLIWEDVGHCTGATNLFRSWVAVAPTDLDRERLRAWLDSHQQDLASCLKGLHKRVIDPSVRAWFLEQRVNPDWEGIDGRAADLWIKQLYRPLAKRLLASGEIGPHSLAPEARLAALSQPSPTVVELDRKLAGLAAGYPLPERLRRLLGGQPPLPGQLLASASPQTNATSAAWPSVEAFLGEPLAPERAIELYNHLLRFYPIWEIAQVNANGVRLRPEKELLARRTPVETGLVRLHYALALTDILIAQQALLAGDVLLPWLHSELHAAIGESSIPDNKCQEGGTRNELRCRYDRVFELLADKRDEAGHVAAQEVLRRNLVMYLLAHERRPRTGGSVAYRVALSASSPVALKTLFGDGWHFVREEGNWALELPSPSDGSPLRVVLPAPEALDEGRLIVPALLEQLTLLRERLADAAMSYYHTRPNADHADLVYQAIAFSTYTAADPAGQP